MENILTAESSDKELMAEYENLNRQACGEAIGDKDHTPTEAAQSEGWEIVRTIYEGTNCPGTPVLARDLRGSLWIVNDINGPWATMVADEVTA